MGAQNYWRNKTTGKGQMFWFQINMSFIALAEPVTTQLQKPNSEFNMNKVRCFNHIVGRIQSVIHTKKLNLKSFISLIQVQV